MATSDNEIKQIRKEAEERFPLYKHPLQHIAFIEGALFALGYDNESVFGATKYLGDEGVDVEKFMERGIKEIDKLLGEKPPGSEHVRYFLSLSISKAVCPHCERTIPYEEIEPKWMKTKQDVIRMKCKCKRFIGITTDFRGDFVAYELNPPK